MNRDEKLNSALMLISNSLIPFSTIEMNHQNHRIELLLKESIRIYIRYNNYEQYSYSIHFSEEKDDRIRYDNFDEHWEIPTKPHHKHIRYSNKVEFSEMIGDPYQDIPKLLNIFQDF